MSLKEEIHKIVDSLPDEDERSIEEMHYRLYVLEKVKRGLLELDRGQGISHDAVKQELAKWLID